MPVDEDSIDALNVLLTIVENLKWLILGPLIGGALVYAMTFALPQKYESTAIIKAESFVASSMTSSHVLNAAMKNLGYFEGLSEDASEDLQESWQENVFASAGRGNQLVTLRVAADSPEAANRMAQEILNQVYIDSKPREVELKRLGAAKALLEQQASEQIHASKAAQKLLEQRLADEAAQASNIGPIAESIASLSANVVDIQTAILEVEKKMDGLSGDDLVQAPSMPRRPIAPRKGLIAAIAAVAIGFALLAGILIWQSWQTSGSFEQHAERLKALKRRFRLG